MYNVYVTALSFIQAKIKAATVGFKENTQVGVVEEVQLKTMYITLAHMAKAHLFA